MSQAIYMQDEINATYNLGDTSVITSITYFAQLDGDIPANTPIKIWMANTTQSSFNGANAWLPQDDFTIVYDGTIDLSATNSTEVNIPLGFPFIYQGDNLVIMVVRPLDNEWYNSANKWECTATPNFPTRTIYAYSDGFEQDPANPTNGQLANDVPNTRFNFRTADFATISGIVSSEGAPLEGAKVAIDGTARYTLTNSQGLYQIDYLVPATVSLTASKFGYADAHATNVVLTANETTTQNFSLSTVSTVTVSGQVIASDTNQGLANALVKLSGYENYEVETDATGAFIIPGVFANNTYTLKINKLNYQTYTQEITVGATNLVVPTITVNELANPPIAVIATSTPIQVDLSWNAPGEGLDLWFTHATIDTYYDCIGTAGAAQFEVAHRYTPAHLAAFGVTDASLTKVQVMCHEPSATYTLKIYRGTSGISPATLIHTQAIPTILEDLWTEIELTNAITIPTDEDLWIAISIVTPEGYPAGCDNGPALNGYGNMMYIGGTWSTLLELSDSLPYNWMIKGLATGATGPRTFAHYAEEAIAPRSNYKEKKNLNPIILSTGSANGEYANRSTTNNSILKQSANNRAVTGYSIWRAPLNTISNEATWATIAEGISQNEYTDPTWAQVETGAFKYAVRAIYTGGVASVPTFSNTVYKNMTANVDINLETADNGSPVGAIVKLSNTDGNPEHIYTQTASSNVVNFPSVWHGIYTITVSKIAYQTVVQENVIIAGDFYSHPTIIMPVSSIFLSEDFEGDFPPTGWSIVDADGDGFNWVHWEYGPYEGDFVAASGSFDNSIGQLFPDNWLITPQLELSPGTTNTLTYMVAPQDPNYTQDQYSILVSTTDANPTSFVEIYNETIMSGNWEERTIDLPYAGENIYVAFRHHSCTDWYYMRLDNVEISRSGAIDENIPSAKLTTLLGNYPNPFNPTTTISYNLANDSHVVIDIYNIKGQKVKTLVNDRVVAGTHNAVWNGQDDSSKNVGSGIYFYNMKTDNYSSTRKMIQS